MNNIFNNDKDSKNVALKSRIVNYFIMNGNSTNNDLAKELGLSVPTVAKIIGEMCEDGFIDEYGKLETDEGRKPNLYGLNPNSGYFVGVDMVPDEVNIGVMNFRGDLIDLDTIAYHQQNTMESLDELCNDVVSFIDKSKINKSKILNVNFNISGRVNPDTGYSYSIFNFSETSLCSLISEKIGYPVNIENDTRAMTYGEYMAGCVKGESNILFVNLSWGLGMGIIINGNLYKGCSGFAGEIGHIHMFDNDILCHCGKKGCLETEASGRAFHRMVNERIAKGETSILAPHEIGEIPLSEIISATNREDPLCIDVVEGIGRRLGEALAGMINIFNPELVIIGGTLSVTGDYLLHSIRSSVMKFSLGLVNKDTNFLISKLGERAGVIGACMLARNASLKIC